MATGKFNTKTNNEHNSIFYRFKQGDQFDIVVSLGISVPKGRWSDTKQEVLPTPLVDFKSINIKIKELNTFILKDFENTKLSDDSIIINSKWLREKIEFFFNRKHNVKELDEKIFLVNFVKAYIPEAAIKKRSNNLPIGKRTIQRFNTTLNKLIDFENHTGVRLKVDQINLSFHCKFLNFLETIQYLKPNTIGAYVDDIKAFCKSAIKKGLNVSNEVNLKEFYSPTNKTNDIYLKEEEILKILQKDIKQDYLQNARDWLIIGLRTGLRISDFLKLSKNNLKDGFIEIINQKTDFSVIIPLHEDVIQILSKRNGDFPRKISDQKFNEYIKEVAKISELNELVNGEKLSEIEITKNGKLKKIFRKVPGIYPKYELVTSHICRRSFASNLYGKIDTLTIMKITGHRTERQFLEYIKITPREYAEQLKAYWTKLKT